MEQGICPELLNLLDVRVEQLELEHDDKDGDCHVKVRGMGCLECGDRFNTYLGDSYLCEKCHGPRVFFVFIRSSGQIKTTYKHANTVFSHRCLTFGMSSSWSILAVL